VDRGTTKRRVFCENRIDRNRGKVILHPALRLKRLAKRTGAKEIENSRCNAASKIHTACCAEDEGGIGGKAAEPPDKPAKCLNGKVVGSGEGAREDFVRSERIGVKPARNRNGLIEIADARSGKDSFN